MSEEQQAVLDENQEFEAMDTQGSEVPDIETKDSQVDSATTDDTTDTTPAEPEKDGVQKRIDKLTAEKYSKDRKIAELEDQLRQGQTKPAESTANQESEGKPTLEQFDFDDAAYNAALVRYEVKQELAAERNNAEQAQVQQAAIERDTKFDNSEVEYMTENPEYANDIRTLPRFPQETLNLLRGQENGPQLVHYLGKNPETALQIANLDTTNAAIQIGAINAKLSATVKPEIKPSTAPDPITPVSSGGVISKNPEDMSMEEIYNS